MSNFRNQLIHFIAITACLCCCKTLATEKTPKTEKEIAAFCSGKDYDNRIKKIEPKEAREQLAHKCFMQSKFQKSKPKAW